VKTMAVYMGIPLYFSTVCRYRLSTFFLAQGVLRRNFKLEETLGSSVKQRMEILRPISSQP